VDPALASLDFAKAGAILADMVVSYLAAGAPPLHSEERDDHDVQDNRSAPVAAGMYLHPSVDTGSGALQSGEHGPPIQLDEQGAIAGLEHAADSDPSTETSANPAQR
jgi:hypothetical protein